MCPPLLSQGLNSVIRRRSLAAFQDVESQALLQDCPERRFAGADKGAPKPAIYKRGDRVYIHALPGQECARIFNLVNARRFNADAFKAGSFQFADVVFILEGTGNAANPQQKALLNFLWYVAMHHNV